MAAVGVVVLLLLSLPYGKDSGEEFRGAKPAEYFDGEGAGSPVVNVSAPAEPQQREIDPDTDSYGEANAGGVTRAGNEVALLGQKVRLRELLSQDGDLINLEFVIRKGIRPRRLFEDGGQQILSYEELHYNNVGYGAATVWLLYQLQSAGGVEVAVSRPDGSEYRVLASDLEKVLDYEYFPAENSVRLDLLEGGSKISRNYRI